MTNTKLLAACRAVLAEHGRIESAMPLSPPDGVKWGVEFLCEYEWSVCLPNEDDGTNCYVFRTSGEAEWFRDILNNDATARNVWPAYIALKLELLDACEAALLDDAEESKRRIMAEGGYVIATECVTRHDFALATLHSIARSLGVQE